MRVFIAEYGSSIYGVINATLVMLLAKGVIDTDIAAWAGALMAAMGIGTAIAKKASLHTHADGTSHYH